jgi:hypothetical protein
VTTHGCIQTALLILSTSGRWRAWFPTCQSYSKKHLESLNQVDVSKFQTFT